MVRSWKPYAVHPASNRFGPRATRSGPRSEDAQPNESVIRRQRFPPTINSATHGRRAWWRAPVSHRNVQVAVRGRPGSSTRRAPSSTSTTVPYARPRSPTTTSGTGCPNTAQSPIDTIPRPPRPGHSASTPSIPASRSPAPKRQELEGSPRVEIKRETPTETMGSNFASSVSPVSSEALVSNPKVKVERGISPELCSDPQINTSGSRRYAPLPLECRKSHPNHAAARSAWARKEQEALRRLGLRVVRSFIREDGMVIDWEAIDSEPTDTAAVIERALLLNDAALRDPPVLSAERTISPLTPASQSTKRCKLEASVDLFEDPSAEASRIRGTSSIPSADGRRHGQIQTTHLDTGDSASVDTPTPIDCFPEGGLRDTAASHAALLPFSSSPHPRSPMRHQTTNDSLLHPPPTSQMRTRASSSQSTRLLHGHSSSPQSFSSPPPSQTALDTLHHILQLKRQISRSSSSAGPPAVSPSPSCRKLYPASKEPQPNSSPSKKRPAESYADVVAAALNESARLSQEKSGRASASSTPLRVYKKRRLVGDGTNLTPRNGPGRRVRVRDSLSPAGHSSPPIAVLGHDTGSPPGSPLTELTPSVSGDELDLSYPASPKPPILDMNSHHPSAEALTDSEPPRPVEPSEPVAGASSLLNIKRLPSEEKDEMESAGLRYLAWYCRTFDTDRRALREAYAPDATFSCPSRNLRAKGRDGILDALTTLGHGFLCTERKAKYEVSFLPGIGTLLAGAQDEEAGYSMNFVLQPGDHEDRELKLEQDTEQWPLVAIMHQIAFREGS